MVEGKNVLVIGLGKSGQAAIDLLLRRGAFPVAFDGKSREELAAYSDRLEAHKIPAYLDKPFNFETEQKIDLLVVSPGVSMELPVVAEARTRGIPIWSELELAYQEKSPELNLLAITGTNGKTTTTHLTANILAAAGYPVLMGGNVGTPLSSLIGQMEKGYWVVEVSSFQLEGVQDFHAHGAAILNITPDHLDRHITMENYIECKRRVFQHQTAKDFVFLNADDPSAKAFAEAASGRVFYFALEQSVSSGVFIENGSIVLLMDGQKKTVCPVEKVRLRGRHNLENALCTVGITYLAGVPTEVIAAGLETFTGVRHRIEEVGTKDGVIYINDSKGTNQISTIKALESFDAPILLIAGGYDKGSGFADLVPYVKAKVKKLIALGATGDKIIRTMTEAGYPAKDCVKAVSLEEAVQKAQKFAGVGDVVLLSPACASWDMFKNYEERGEVFCRLVQESLGNL